ncbi:membrane protein [Alkalihalobacillus alcalophilus ATCC 27647 = CGMCC 1.3604]|uniref:Membrane protein n=4 Tax=Bacillaceae TaxID=186817 RepID=A0A094XAJ2_ALKAL|nr:membrane protein [Alkalihalobacillus alcalophilus ATCC 27647 = CGMCC 1.3604]KHF38282.1 membrane protein [Halalkalibacter okhensis]THG88902.1 membrane protein [Alkalihalobacillus alcalophilus ATCC 27647 = CGMCC 1.3604]
MQMSIKTKFINSNALKLLAVIAMVVDHASIWLVPDDTTLAIFARGFGRLAAPIIGYMIAEGYFYTSNKQKYLKRLFIFALISHFPFVMYFGLEWWQGTSVIWGLFMGLVALAISQTTYISRLIKVMIIALCCLLAWTADWNYILVLWILFFGIYKGQFKMQMISFAFIGTVFYILPGISLGMDYAFRFGILLAIPFLALYNGERGKSSALIKWGFYVFYPAHLLVLYILRYFIFA